MRRAELHCQGRWNSREAAPSSGVTQMCFSQKATATVTARTPAATRMRAITRGFARSAWRRQICQTGRSKSPLSHASRNAFLWLWWQSVSRPTRLSEFPAASGGTRHIMATQSLARTCTTAAAPRGGAIDGSPPSRKREAPGQEEACRFLTEGALPATGVMRLSILSWELITIPGWSLGVDSCRM